MLPILILVIAAVGCGFCVGVAAGSRRKQRRGVGPVHVVVRMEGDDGGLAEFLMRERRYLRRRGEE